MNNAKPSTGYLKITIGPETRVILSTNRPIEEEIFAQIKYFSEVKKVGLEFVRSFGHTKPLDAWLLFQAFIRQAETFYQSANQLNYRASALMYYYSFLNLAKGFISLTEPEFVIKPVGHGIRSKFKAGAFTKQFINLETSGVFPKFYELLIGEKLPPQSQLHIVKALGYCTDIAHEYTMAKFGERSFRPATIRLLSNINLQSSWPVLAISNFNSKSTYKPPKSFSKSFDQVKFEIPQARELFDIHAENYRNFSFYESKKDYIWIDNKIQLPQILQDMRLALKGYYEPNLYEDSQNSLLVFNTLQKQTLLNQTLAIYSIMFYLGSLVRYRPDYLEHLLDSKEAWIIERFTKSAPLTFLRAINNYILKKEYIYVSR